MTTLYRKRKNPFGAYLHICPQNIKYNFKCKGKMCETWNVKNKDSGKKRTRSFIIRSLAQILISGKFPKSVCLMEKVVKSMWAEYCLTMTSCTRCFLCSNERSASLCQACHLVTTCGSHYQFHKLSGSVDCQPISIVQKQNIGRCIVATRTIKVNYYIIRILKKSVQNCLHL